MWPPGAVADSTAHCTEPHVSKCKFTSPRASKGTIHGRIIDCSDPVLKVCGAHLILMIFPAWASPSDDGGFLQGLALAQQHVIAAGADR